MKLINSDITQKTPNGKLPVQSSVIHRDLDKKRTGLAGAKRFISTRIAMHLRLAVDLDNWHSLWGCSQGIPQHAYNSRL